MSDRILTIIPAKGTSRRVPNKNLADLGGKPLVLWTIEAALAVDASPHCVVVSSDSRAILEVANSHGAHPLQRPPELCEDPAQMPDVALHALQSCAGFDPTVVCVLLPTSPFRTTQHLREALALHRTDPERRNVVSVCSGAPLRWKYCLEDDDRIVSEVPAREPPSWPWAAGPDCCVRLLNGAIWITTPDRLRRDGFVRTTNALPYLMDDLSGLDIDTQADLAAARWLASQRVP